jgi:uncharacterized membrane protein
MHTASRFWAALLLLQVLLSSASAQVSIAAPPTQEPPAPVVQAAMFWMESCGNCLYIIEEVLPGLEGKFGDQLEIRLIELASIAEVNLLYETAEAFEIPKEQVGVPFLVIGDHVLSGSVEIPEKLPGMVEAYLSTGGVGLPAALVAGLAKVTTENTASQTSADNTSSLAESGFGLGATVLIGMLGALLYSGISIFGGRLRRRNPAWTQSGTLTLTLIGMGIAIYLTYVETQAIPAICGPVGDCNAVQTSPYAHLFGFLPVALAGVAGYITILALVFYGNYSKSKLAALAPVGIFCLTMFGSLFSLYLTYLELFVIKAVCSWCLATAVIMTLLMIINIKPARLAFEKTKDDQSSTNKGEIVT